MATSEFSGRSLQDAAQWLRSCVSWSKSKTARAKDGDERREARDEVINWLEKLVTDVVDDGSRFEKPKAQKRYEELLKAAGLMSVGAMPLDTEWTKDEYAAKAAEKIYVEWVENTAAEVRELVAGGQGTAQVASGAQARANEQNMAAGVGVGGGGGGAQVAGGAQARAGEQNMAAGVGVSGGGGVARVEAAVGVIGSAAATGVGMGGATAQAGVSGQTGSGGWVELVGQTGTNGATGRVMLLESPTKEQVSSWLTELLVKAGKADPAKYPQLEARKRRIQAVADRHQPLAFLAKHATVLMQLLETGLAKGNVSHELDIAEWIANMFDNFVDVLEMPKEQQFAALGKIKDKVYVVLEERALKVVQGDSAQDTKVDAVVEQATEL